MSTIPRNQPILEELQEIVDQDRRVRINRRLVNAHQETVMGMVADLQRQYARQTMSADLIAYLRENITDTAESDMGAAYVAYVRRRVWRLTEALMEEWVLLAEEPNSSKTRTAMLKSIEGAWEVGDEERRLNLEEDFLDRFDVTYRIRRLQFVIRRLNQHAEEEPLDERSRDAMDAFKATAYDFLEALYGLRRALSGSKLFDDAMIEKLYAAARDIPLPRDRSMQLLRDLSGALDLRKIDREVDVAFQGFIGALGAHPLKQAFLADYVGFPVFDVLLYAPGARDLGPDPLTPIQVARISPRDAESLSSAFKGLKSTPLMSFLGFFNREYREHDYLWGRLNAADRLVDLVTSAAADHMPEAERDALKRRLFSKIIERERGRLYRCDAELAELEALVASLGAAADPSGG
jgi:hypothetical protein